MARLKPPPHVPPMTMLDSSILDLFDGFGTPHRPTATDWRASLDAAMNRLGALQERFPGIPTWPTRDDARGAK